MGPPQGEKSLTSVFCSRLVENCWRRGHHLNSMPAGEDCEQCGRMMMVMITNSAGGGFALTRKNRVDSRHSAELKSDKTLMKADIEPYQVSIGVMIAGDTMREELWY